SWPDRCRQLRLTQLRIHRRPGRRNHGDHRMSAYMGAVYTDRVELVTDGATYMPDGTMVQFTEKVIRSDHVPAAITARGRLRDTTPLQLRLLGWFQDLGTFDGAMAAFQAHLDDLRERGCGPCEVAVAGLSES